MQAVNGRKKKKNVFELCNCQQYKTKDYMQITPLLKSLRQFMWHMKYTLYASNNQIHTIFLLLVFLWALKRRNMKYTLLLIQFNFDHVCKNCICIVVVQTTWTYFLARFFWFKDKSAFFFVVWNLMSFENSTITKLTHTFVKQEFIHTCDNGFLSLCAYSSFTFFLVPSPCV